MCHWKEKGFCVLILKRSQSRCAFFARRRVPVSQWVLSVRPKTPCSSHRHWRTTTEEQPMVVCWGCTRGASTGVYRAHSPAAGLALKSSSSSRNLSNRNNQFPLSQNSILFSFHAHRQLADWVRSHFSAGCIKHFLTEFVSCWVFSPLVVFFTLLHNWLSEIG